MPSLWLVVSPDLGSSRRGCTSEHGVPLVLRRGVRVLPAEHTCIFKFLILSLCDSMTDCKFPRVINIILQCPGGWRDGELTRHSRLYAQWNVAPQRCSLACFRRCCCYKSIWIPAHRYNVTRVLHPRLTSEIPSRPCSQLAPCSAHRRRIHFTSAD